MPARQESCCFTGHRPAKLPWGMDDTDARGLRLNARIADALEAAYQSGYRHFICGRPWFPGNIPPGACCAGTGIWWIMPRC